MTIQPASTAIGTYSSDTAPPAENSAISTSLKLKEATSSTSCNTSLKLKVFPTDFALANKYNRLIGNSRSCKTVKKASPTKPVAPTIATFKAFIYSPLEKYCFSCLAVSKKTPEPPCSKSSQVNGTIGYARHKASSVLPTSTTRMPSSLK